MFSVDLCAGVFINGPCRLVDGARSLCARVESIVKRVLPLLWMAVLVVMRDVIAGSERSAYKSAIILLVRTLFELCGLIETC